MRGGRAEKGIGRQGNRLVSLARDQLLPGERKDHVSPLWRLSLGTLLHFSGASKGPDTAVRYRLADQWGLGGWWNYQVAGAAHWFREQHTRDQEEGNRTAG